MLQTRESIDDFLSTLIEPKEQQLGAQTELEIPGVNVSAQP